MNDFIRFIAFLLPYFLGFVVGILWVGVKALPMAMHAKRYIYIRARLIERKATSTDQWNREFVPDAADWDKIFLSHARHEDNLKKQANGTNNKSK